MFFTYILGRVVSSPLAVCVSLWFFVSLHRLSCAGCGMLCCNGADYPVPIGWFVVYSSVGFLCVVSL